MHTINPPSRTLLIVRPAARAAADAAVCAQHGWTGVPFSPLRIEPLPFSGSLKQGFDQADAVFWVSPTAVETAAAAGVFEPCSKTLSGSLNTGKPCTHAAVGAATARALHEAGAHPVLCHPNGNDSEAAFTLPLWRGLPQGALVLIAGGEGGRNWLAQGLRGLGLRVEAADLYRRVPQDLDWTVFQAARPAAAWVTSVQLAEALFAQAPANMAQALQSLLYFAHHERIRAALSAAGAKYVAPADTIQAVLAALNRQPQH